MLFTVHLAFQLSGLTARVQWGNVQPELFHFLQASSLGGGLCSGLGLSSWAIMTDSKS